VHWYVSQEGGARLGADFLLGEKAHLSDLGAGVSAEVTALATAGAGAKMEFTDEKQAREFMTAAAHEPVKDSLTGWDPTGFTHWVADQVDGHHPAGGSVIGKIAFSMDLTDKGNVDALANGLHSVGIPVLRGNGSYPPPSVRDGIGGLYSRFDQGANGTTVTVTTHDISTSGGTVGAKGGDVLTFGAEAGLAFVDTTATSGYYYSPGDGFVTWQQCTA